MRKILLLSFLFCLPCFIAAAQNFLWAGKHSNVFNPPLVATDGNSVLYTASFTNNATIGTQTFTANGSFVNAYLAKSDINGNYKWVKQFKSRGIEILDAQIDHLENIVVCGNYNDFLIINDTIFNNNTSNSFFFIAKFGPGGKLLWAITSNQYSSGIDGNVAFDRDGNIYCSSSSSGGITFGANVLVPAPFTTAPKPFLVKFDPKGNYLWGKTIGSGNAWFEYPALTVTPNKDVYVSFTVRANSAGGFTSYQLYKFNTAGVQQWVRPMPIGSGASVYNSPKLKADPNNNVYIAGIFHASIGFGSISVSSPANIYGQLFLAKIDETGNWQWAQQVATGNYEAEKITFSKDLTNNLSVAGNFKGTISFGTNTFTAPANKYNSFIAKLTTAGTLLNAYHLSSSNQNYVGRIASDKAGNNLISGVFENSISLSSINLSATGASGFAGKFLYNANAVTGTFFIDNNANGIWETTEPPYPYGMLATNPGGAYLTTSEKGEYNAYFPAGAFTLTPIQPQHHYTFTPQAPTLTFAGTGQNQLINFALAPIPNRSDVKVTVTNLTPARPGFLLKYRITYENVGTTTIADSLILNYNAAFLTFTSSFPAAATQLPGKVKWFYQPLEPTESRSIDVSFTVAPSTPINTTLITHAIAKPLNDFFNWNNQDTLYHKVTGSFDPNDKQVSHATLTPSQVANGKLLDYVIRFQNIGTDTAFTVIVRDSISDKLHMPSFELLSASHPYTFRLLPDGMAEWRFDNINLPDSAHNEPASHGFIRYRMKPKNNLLLGDEIKARAAIYFDFNAPVHTNFAVTRIANPLGIKETKAGLEAFNLYPNPAKNFVTLVADLKKETSAKIILVNMAGQTVAKVSLPISSQIRYELPLQNLPKGVYLVRLETEQGVISKRLLVQ
jgi:hypothetical protein